MDKNKGLNLNTINEKIKLLQLGGCSVEIVKKSIDELMSLSQQAISLERKDVAQLFEEILKRVQELYCGETYAIDKIPRETVDSLLNLYLHIRAIGVESTDAEKSDGSIMLIMFLSFLEQHNGTNGNPSYDSYNLENVRGYVESLSDLEDVRFIFDIQKEDGRIMFPIEEMLAYVIKDTKFLSKANGLQTFHIQIFSFAVRFFKPGSDKDLFLKELIEKCHLQFINYLHPGDYLMDTPDLLNYRMNGVMLFIKGSGEKKILIRSNRENYFSQEVVNHFELSIQKEVSKDQSYDIGCYVEMPYDFDYYTDAADLMKNEVSRQKVLKIFFEGYHNIFLEKSLFMDDKGNIYPVNPFGRGDEYVIRKNDFYKGNEIFKIFEQYYNLPLKTSSYNFFNRVFVGTALTLIQLDDTNGKDLLDLSYDENDFYQNQLIYKWINGIGKRIDKLSRLLIQWYENLQYCIRKTNEEQKEEYSVEGHIIVAQSFFPFTSDFKKMLSILSEDYNSDDCEILSGMVNEEGGNRKITVQKETMATVLSGEKIIDKSDVWRGMNNGQRCFVISTKGNYFLDNQTICQVLYNLTIIWSNCMDYDTITNISRFSYDEVVNCLRLHQMGLSKEVKRVFADENFEDQAYYRILHNMIRYGVKAVNVQDYFRIFQAHDRMTFLKISEDEIFQMSDEHALYIPKNALKAGSALWDVYNKYLKNPVKRNDDGLYNNEILSYDNTKKKYLVQNKVVKKIVLLCDNFESGGQTIRVLKAYLGIDINSSEAERIQRYYSAEGEIKIADVVNKNACSLLVHGYYGTEKGKNAINDFLHDNGFIGEATYSQPISKKIEDIYEVATRIYGKKDVSKKAYAVIREFNMTKCNVFPEEMLINPQKAITLFLKKEEIERPTKNVGTGRNVKNVRMNREQSILALENYFIEHGFGDRDIASASTLTVFSILPPGMRIEVLERIISKDHNPIVLEKLSKAYAKAGKMDVLKSKLDEWIEKDYINAKYAELLFMASEPLYRYREKLPIANSLDASRKNFENVVAVTQAPDDFLELMRGILNI